MSWQYSSGPKVGYKGKKGVSNPHETRGYSRQSQWQNIVEQHIPYVVDIQSNKRPREMKKVMRGRPRRNHHSIAGVSETPLS